MILAADLSVFLGMLTTSAKDRLQNLLIRTGLPVNPDQNPLEILNFMRLDKKREGNEINFILLEKLGKATIQKIGLNKLEDILHDLYQHS